MIVFGVRLAAGPRRLSTNPQTLVSKIYCIGATAYESLHYDKQRLHQTC